MKTLLDDRRVLLPLLLTAVAIAIGSLSIVMLSGDASATASTSSMSTPSAHGGVTIDIANYLFKPARVTVKAGTKVTWVNHDSSPHTATASGPGGFDTGTLTKGHKKTLTLKKRGTYAYICQFHPFMKATVVVR